MRVLRVNYMYTVSTPIATGPDFCPCKRCFINRLMRNGLASHQAPRPCLQQKRQQPMRQRQSPPRQQLRRFEQGWHLQAAWLSAQQMLKTCDRRSARLLGHFVSRTRLAIYVHGAVEFLLGHARLGSQANTASDMPTCIRGPSGCNIVSGTCTAGTATERQVGNKGRTAGGCRGRSSASCCCGSAVGACTDQQKGQG